MAGIESALYDAVARPILDELRSLRAEVAELKQTRSTAGDSDALVTLDRILSGKSSAAVRMQVSRDRELASLGVRVGRRLLFRPSEVLRLYAERQQQAGRRGGRPVGPRKQAA